MYNFGCFTNFRVDPIYVDPIDHEYLSIKKLLNFLKSFLVGDDSLFRFIGSFEPLTTSDEKSECSKSAELIFFGNEFLNFNSAFP